MINKLTEADDIAQMLEDTALALRVRRGEFYPNKDFGSKINADEQDEEILAYARQAVSTLDGVYVKSIERKENDIIVFNLTLNDEERQAEIKYD